LIPNKLNPPKASSAPTATSVVLIKRFKMQWTTRKLQLKANAQMDKRKLCLIYNPAARGEKARLLDSKLRSFAQDATIFGSEKPGDAKRLATEAVQEGFDTIVAAGGDGTVNEVVNGMADSEASLGILPLGTMNVFAQEMGLSSNQIGQCWEVILNGATRSIDLPSANAHYFVQLAGVGLDAQALQETDREMRRTIGPLSYLISAAEIIGRPAPNLLVTSPDCALTTASFVLVGNGKYYGGPVAFFRDAENDDGLLDVLIFKNLGYFEIARYLQELLVGTHKDKGDIEYFQTASLQISSDQEVPVEIDGEVVLQTPIHFQISGKRLKVIVPVE
jgi:diacylglycerol kinase (ATP)